LRLVRLPGRLPVRHRRDELGRPRGRARDMTAVRSPTPIPPVAVPASPGERMAVRRAPLAQRLPVDPLGIVGLLVLVALWWAVTALELVSPVFLPPPGQVAQAIADNLFASPYFETYNVGTGGIVGSLVYTVSNV